MNTINLNVPLVTMEGTTSPDTTLCKILADTIATETEGKTLKLFGWYKTLQAGEPLQLDDADLQDLRTLVDTNKRLYLYVKGQILDVLKSPGLQ